MTGRPLAIVARRSGLAYASCWEWQDVAAKASTADTARIVFGATRIGVSHYGLAEVSASLQTMSRLAAALAVSSLHFCGAASGATLDVDARDPSGMPVADTAIYAMPAAGGIDARPGKVVEIQQIDREFVPYLTVIQTGTTATFPNRDPILHHVYSFSPAKSFEIKLYTGRSPSEVMFDKPGVVTLGCNIHDWMIGYVLIVSTPYFARTDASGTAHLRDLPAGSYEVQAWHPRLREALAPVGVSLDAAAVRSLAFTIDAIPRKPKYKPPLDRLKY
jgi:plastocyanin